MVSVTHEPPSYPIIAHVFSEVPRSRNPLLEPPAEAHSVSQRWPNTLSRQRSVSECERERKRQDMNVNDRILTRMSICSS